MKMKEFSKHLIAEAANLGFETGAIDTTRRHNRLPLSYPGGSLYIVFPKSPSDNRAIYKARAFLRRTAREVGVTSDASA